MDTNTSTKGRTEPFLRIDAAVPALANTFVWRLSRDLKREFDGKGGYELLALGSKETGVAAVLVFSRDKESQSVYSGAARRIAAGLCHEYPGVCCSPISANAAVDLIRAMCHV